MLCDRYKEALMDVAATGASPAGAMREHINACSNCSAFLARQEAIFASVDAGVRATANARVPQNFAQRMRAVMREESSREKRALAPIFALGSVVVAAVLVLVLVKVADRNRDRRAERPSALVASESPSVGKGRDARKSDIENVKPVIATDSMIARKPKPRVARPIGGDVLVPSGQEELLVKYMEALAARRQRVTLSVSLQHEPEMKAVEVPPLEVAQAAVKPLPDLRFSGF
jgi:hypothetical protein